MKNKKTTFKLRDKKLTIFIGVFLSLFLIFGFNELVLAKSANLMPTTTATNEFSNPDYIKVDGDSNLASTTDFDDEEYIYGASFDSTSLGTFKKARVFFSWYGENFADDQVILEYSPDSGTTWFELATYDSAGTAVPASLQTEVYDALAIQSWTDVGNTRVQVSNNKMTGPDNADCYVDAVWVQVVYDDGSGERSFEWCYEDDTSADEWEYAWTNYGNGTTVAPNLGEVFYVLVDDSGNYSYEDSDAIEYTTAHVYGLDPWSWGAVIITTDPNTVAGSPPDDAPERDTGIDITDYNLLEFWVRGIEGNDAEEFRIEIKDVRDNMTNGVDVWSYCEGDAVTDTYQRVQIPLAAFKWDSTAYFGNVGEVDVSRIRAIAFLTGGDQATASWTVYIDNIRFVRYGYDHFWAFEDPEDSGSATEWWYGASDEGAGSDLVCYGGANNYFPITNTAANVYDGTDALQMRIAYGGDPITANSWGWFMTSGGVDEFGKAPGTETGIGGSWAEIDKTKDVSSCDQLEFYIKRDSSSTGEDRIFLEIKSDSNGRTAGGEAVTWSPDVGTDYPISDWNVVPDIRDFVQTDTSWQRVEVPLDYLDWTTDSALKTNVKYVSFITNAPSGTGGLGDATYYIDNIKFSKNTWDFKWAYEDDQLGTSPTYFNYSPVWGDSGVLEGVTPGATTFIAVDTSNYYKGYEALKFHFDTSNYGAENYGAAGICTDTEKTGHPPDDTTEAETGKDISSFDTLSFYIKGEAVSGGYSDANDNKVCMIKLQDTADDCTSTVEISDYVTISTSWQEVEIHLPDDFTYGLFTNTACEYVVFIVDSTDYPNSDDWTFYVDNLRFYDSNQILGATAVSLSDFYAIGYSDEVKIFWKTESEYKNAGFNLYRKEEGSTEDYIRIHEELIDGLDTTSLGGEYSFIDKEVENGKTYWYKLEDIETTGQKTTHGPVAAHPGLDSDGDRMTDDWERHYGIDPYLDDSEGDLDQDGLTNLEEFLAEADSLENETQIIVIAGSTQESNQEPLRIIASNDDHIVMELVTTSFDLEEKIGNGAPYKSITIPDYIHGYTSETGEPQLPAKGVLVGVPQGASANIGASDHSFREYKTTYNIYPVPEITKVDGHLEEEFTIDQAAYSKDEYYPGNLVEVVYTGELRSQRVANIRFYPFQFNPQKSSLKFYERIRVEIVFGEESSSSSDTEIPGVAVPANDEPRLKLTLKEEGIYRLTGYDLVDAGLSLFWIDPATIKLYNLGEEIPIKINGQADGQFDLADEIVFFVEALDTKYSKTNVYWLTYGGGAGLRMEESLGSEDDDPIGMPDKFLSFYRYEEDKFYWTELEGGEDTDRWFFNTFIWGGRERDFDIDLTNIVSDETHQAKIKFTMRGFFDTPPYPNHHALIYLNDNLLDDALWSGQTEHILERDDISQSYLDDTSTITLKALLAPGAAYDLILPNYFEFEYWKNLVAEDNILRFNYEGEGTYLFEIPGFTSDDIKIFDITDKREVMYLANFEINDAYTASFKDNLSGKKEYIALTSDKMMIPESMEVDEPSNLRSTDNQADYIIITDQEFYYAVLSLAYLRESLGLRTEVVKIDDVYDDFNFGIQSPYAIKDFLKFAYNDWQKPAPTYVLLAGDASYDYKDNLGRGKSNYVPTYLLWTPYAGETGSDNWFVCLDGEEDILPDMFIGRIPVRTYEEAQAVVEKIMDYEEKSAREDWMEKVVIVADNEPVFEETSDKLADLLPRKFEASKLYIRYHPYPEVLTQKMVDDINEGALILNYVGHGSTELWADEQILDIQAIDLFNNADRLPIVVSMTCLDGFYLHAQQYPCMAETFLKKEQGGAVAVWSPTGMGLPQGHQILNTSLYEAFFDDNNIIFGSATTQAKISLFLQDGKRYNDLIHTYTLFGDPSLRLKIKKEKPLPVVVVTKVKKALQIQVEETEEISGFEAIFDDVIENYESAKGWRNEDKEAEESYELPEAFEDEGAEGEASLGPAIGEEGDEDDSIEKPNYKPARLLGKVLKAKGESGDDITNLQKSEEQEIIATESSEDTLQIEKGDSPSEKSLWLRIREALRRFFEKLHSRFIRR